VNDSPASLTTVLRPGDDISVNAASDGENAAAKVSDVVSRLRTGSVNLNNSSIDIGTKIYVNGELANLDREIAEGDSIQLGGIKTLKDLLEISEIDITEYDVFINNKLVGELYELKNGDIVECRKKTPAFKGAIRLETAESVSKAEKKSDKAEDKAEAKKVEVEIDQKLEEKVEAAESHSKIFSVIVNGKPTEMRGNKSQYMFIDIFNFISFDLTKPQGNIVLKLNGRQAGFTDEIQHGDKIDIYWEK
jgi:molybdopterin converting factor small subunit